MPSPPYSTASARVRLSSAPLAAAYGAMPGTGLTASVDATLTIARSPSARSSSGSAACGTRYGPRRLIAICSSQRSTPTSWRRTLRRIAPALLTTTCRPPNASTRRRDDPRRVRGDRQVGGDGERPPARGLDLGGDVPERLGPAAGEHDGAAVGGEGERGGPADPGPAAGHERAAGHRRGSVGGLAAFVASLLAVAGRGAAVACGCAAIVGRVGAIVGGRLSRGARLLGLVELERVADRGADVALPGSLVALLGFAVPGVGGPIGLIAVIGPRALARA